MSDTGLYFKPLIDYNLMEISSFHVSFKNN